MPKKLNRKKSTKVFQFFAAYLVAAWTLLQFIDWVLIRYSISPYWVDFLLWVFIGIIPSLIIYLYHQERINKRVLRLREKIIFPLNVLLIMAVTYFGFGNSDLGATTKEISYTNESGDLETHVITKDEFRIGVPIYNFKQVTLDSTTLWINNVVNDLIALDLTQDKNITSGAKNTESTIEKVQWASLYYDYYVDGYFELVDSIYYLTPVVRSSKNGKELSRQTFKGTDFPNLIDDVSVFIREHVGIVEDMRNKYIDLSVKDITTTSMEALEQYSYKNYEKAAEIDSTFALAYLLDATRKIHFSQSKLEEQSIIDKAFEHRKRLPLQYQNMLLIQRNIAYDNWKEAEALVKLQLEINPNDIESIRRLYIIYSQTKNIDAFYKLTESRYAKNPDQFNTTYAGRARLIRGSYSEYLYKMEELISLSPNNNNLPPYKTLPLLLSGDIEAATNNHEKTKLVHPEWTHSNPLFDEAINYHKSTNGISKDFSKFIGNYRNFRYEQTLEYFEFEDKLLMLGSNQLIQQALIGGENIISYPKSGAATTIRHEFQKDSTGNIYRIKAGQTSPGKETFYSYFYKEDGLITKANTLLKEHNLIDAKTLYIDAIQKHPEHWYLIEMLKYINYIKNVNSNTLLNQYEQIVGSYGPRTFWIENNRLFYKRKGLDKIELLPISKNRYINLSKYDTHMYFEFLDNNTIASYSWDYDIEKEQWIETINENNYFIKED